MNTYEIQQALGTAIEAVLAAGQTYVATANIQKNRDTTLSTVPRYEIKIGEVSRASAQMIYVPTVGWVYSHFTADTTVELVTQRGSSTNHPAAVARTRYLFSQEAQSFTASVVTAFEVLSLESTNEAQDVNEQAREDWSQLGFRFNVGLLPGAYIVPSAG